MRNRDCGETVTVLYWGRRAEEPVLGGKRLFFPELLQGSEYHSPIIYGMLALLLSRIIVLGSRDNGKKQILFKQ